MPDVAPLPVPVLRADCAACLAICCVVPEFAVSVDFAIDKPGGVPCPNLAADLRCSIHEHLRERGFRGCVSFDCFGAGQRISTAYPGGGGWFEDAAAGRTMFAAFPVVRLLHELLWYLVEARSLAATSPIHAALDEAIATTNRQAAEVAGARSGQPDAGARWALVNPLLREASVLARAASPGPRVDHRGADLVGEDLRPIDLRGADLRGAQLVGADLRGMDLTLADVTGADLRGANLAGADLATTLFLTPMQVASASGDRLTRLPRHLERPAHWT